jgi:sec-independent protein translocase protein TatC
MRRPSEYLQKWRPYAIIGIFVVSPLLTPTSTLRQLALALPLVALYEVSIWCAKAAGR